MGENPDSLGKRNIAWRLYGFHSICVSILILIWVFKKRSEPPISRILSPVRVTSNRVTIIHLWMPVARHLLRPTLELERAALKRSSIRSCTGWGLHSFSGHPKNWCALTAPFHPYPEDTSPFQGRRSKAVYFLLHFPSRRRDSTLWSTLPCGVRTFLRTIIIRRSFVLLRPYGYIFSSSPINLENLLLNIFHSTPIILEPLNPLRITPTLFKIIHLSCLNCLQLIARWYQKLLLFPINNPMTIGAISQFVASMKFIV